MEAAQAAPEEMRHWSAFERANLCLRAFELWKKRVDEIARILTMEHSKPYRAEAIDEHRRDWRLPNHRC